MDYLNSIIDEFRPTGNRSADERRAFMTTFFVYDTDTSSWERCKKADELLVEWATEQFRKVVVPGPAGDLLVKSIIRDIFASEYDTSSYYETELFDMIEEAVEDLQDEDEDDDDDSVHECELCNDECCSEHYVGMCDNDCGVEHMCDRCATTNMTVGKVLCPNCADKFPSSDTE